MNILTVVLAVWIAEWITWSAITTYTAFSQRKYINLDFRDPARVFGFLIGFILTTFGLITAWPLCALIAILDHLAERESEEADEES